MNKKVVCSIYHIDEAKFSTRLDDLIKEISMLTYIMISENTKNQLKKY